jgi:RimJ/RimL family protein N-acetyltransferase
MTRETVFETERLIARRWDPALDAEAAFEMYGDPAVTEFIGGQTAPDVATVRANLEKAVERNTSKFGEPFGSFPLFLRTSGELIGTAIMKPLVDGADAIQPEIEIGWHLVKRAWGQGYATEMARALLARAFALTREEKIWVVVQPPNARSIAVAKRIGMTYVGRKLHARLVDRDRRRGEVQEEAREHRPERRRRHRERVGREVDGGVERVDTRRVGRRRGGRDLLGRRRGLGDRQAERRGERVAELGAPTADDRDHRERLSSPRHGALLPTPDRARRHPEQTREVLSLETELGADVTDGVRYRGHPPNVHRTSRRRYSAA